VLAHAPTGPLQRTHLMPRHTVSLFLTRDAAADARGSYGARPHGFGRFGAVVVTPAAMPLHVRLSGAPPRRLLSCSFSPALFDRWDGLAERWSAARLQACLDVRDRLVEDALRRMADEALAPGLASLALVQGLGLAVAAQLSRCLDGRAPPVLKGGLAPWQLRRIQDRAADGPAPGITDLAALCGISARHLMRAFKAGTGETVAAYVERVRAARAQALLRDGEQPVAEIAREMGFASASGFAAAFRRVTGETPRAFRRRSRT
jgi:AraC family transcriptional regulator